jgi:hypothetical protein
LTRMVSEQRVGFLTMLDDKLALATREPTAWRQVEDLIATRRPAKYDQAVKLIADLRELGVSENRVAAADAQVQRLRDRHAKKESLLTRLRRAGLSRRC